jgi:hypothetical protein
MTATETSRPALDLVGRSWAALGIGVGLLVMGAIILDSVAGAFDPAPIATVGGVVVGALGGMTVQAAIVGFVFGSYDGVRRTKQPLGPDDDPAAAERRAAGWYPDPTDASLVRWWDGGRWTETRPSRDPA